MKKPDDIKKGLIHCTQADEDCNGCPYDPLCFRGDLMILEKHALAYIQQLEEKYKRVMENAKILSDAVTKLERERDFLIKYLTESTFTPCDICKHGVEGESVIDCEQIRKVGFPCFEWRGLPEV